MSLPLAGTAARGGTGSDEPRAQHHIAHNCTLAQDGSEVLAAVDAHRPDVVVMDLRMPKVDGLAATALLRGQPRPPHVLVLTAFDADDLVLRALRAGVDGFVLKDTPPPDILPAIELVAAGDGILSPTVARQLIAHVAGEASGTEDRRIAARHRLDALTDRERDVARAIAQGQTNAQIAGELYLSVATVKAHVTRLLSKLDVQNRVQIALLVDDARPGLEVRQFTFGLPAAADAVNSPRGPGAERFRSLGMKSQ